MPATDATNIQTAMATTTFGCFASVSIEKCVNSDGNNELALRNTAKLIAMIVTEDSRINGMVKGKFNDNRIAQHNAWSGKNCPIVIRGKFGQWDRLMAMVDEEVQLITGTSKPDGFADPAPAPKWDGEDKRYNRATWYAISRKVHAKKRAVRRAWASDAAPVSGEAIPKGGDVNVKWVVQSWAGNWWYVDAEGHRYRMSSFEERFIPKRARRSTD